LNINRIVKGSNTLISTWESVKNVLVTKPVIESVGNVFEFFQVGTSQALNSIIQLDWRMESTSSIAHLYDQLSGQSPLIQQLQNLQNFIRNSRQKMTPASLTLEVELILVRADYRSQGIGAMMVQDIDEFSRINQIERIDLYQPQECFKKEGFKKICFELEENEEERGEPFVLMSKLLRRNSNI